MSWDLCTSGSAVAKAGLNANSDIITSGSILAKWSDEAEGTVCMKTRRDWVATAGGTQVMKAVGGAVSGLIAMKIVSYDMSGYTSRIEAQTVLDVLKDNFDTTIKDLRQKNNQVIHV